MTPRGPISGLRTSEDSQPLCSNLSDSCRTFISLTIQVFHKVKGEKQKRSAPDKYCYLSIPARAATADAFDLSTNPGPDGIFAPGRSPAPLL